MSYVPSPSIKPSIAVKSRKVSDKPLELYLHGGRPKIKPVVPLETCVTEKERISLFYRRQYLKKLAGDKPAPNYSKEEITKMLER